jgi:hypothetical protein
VEQLARVDGLGDPVMEVQPAHLLVGDLGVDAHHLGVVQRLDEGQHVAGGGQVDVAPRLVGLGLQGKADVVLLVARVVAEEVDALAVALDRLPRVATGVGLGPFPPSPHHEYPGAQLDPEVDRAHGLLDREGAHLRVVGGEAAVLEDGMREQVRGGHRDLHPVVGERGLELAHDPVALGGAGPERDEVVVVQVDAVGAELRQLLDDVGRGQGLADGLPEGVAARIAHGPQTEGELVGLLGGVGVGHGVSSRDGGRQAQRPPTGRLCCVWPVVNGSGVVARACVPLAT